MRKTSLFLLPFAASVLFAGQVLAQTATDSAQGLRDSVKQKVEEELSQIKKAVYKKAFLGTITAKSDATVTMNTYRNETRQVLVSTDTVIKLKGSKDGTLKDLSVGDFILVMGDVDSQNSMTARRLLVITAPGLENRSVSYGRVITAGTTLTLKTLAGQTLTGKLSSATVVTKIDAGKSVKAKSTDIKVGDTVIIITKSGATLTILDLQIVSSVSPSPTP